MKISEFSQIFNISIYSISFYVKMGLLVPNICNKQYQFTEECIHDMNMIIELKSFQFSLKEIHSYLSLYRVSNFATKMDNEKRNNIFIKNAMNLSIKKMIITNY